MHFATISNFHNHDLIFVPNTEKRVLSQNLRFCLAACFYDALGNICLEFVDDFRAFHSYLLIFRPAGITLAMANKSLLSMCVENKLKCLFLTFQSHYFFKCQVSIICSAAAY